MPSLIPQLKCLRIVVTSACAALLWMGTASTEVRAQEFAVAADNVSRPLSPPSNDSKPAGKNTSSPAGTAGSLMTTCGALGMVLLLFLGLARLWKKQTPAGTPILQDDVVEPLGQRILGPKQAVQLVRIGNRILILGSSEDGLRTLAELTDPQEVEHLTQLCRGQKTSAESSAFRAMYEQFLRRSASTPAIHSTTQTSRPSEYAEAGHDS